MKICIKHMVSNRCKLVVMNALESMNIHYRFVDLGEVDLPEEISIDQRDELKNILLVSSLELMEDKNGMMIENLKSILMQMVHNPEKVPETSNSIYLSRKLGTTYPHLTELFTEVTGTSINSYLISQRIERVKNLLLADELNLTEISYMMEYSSVAHLSNQFKKITGITPSYFKHIKAKTVCTYDAKE